MPKVLFDRISSLTKVYVNHVFPSHKLRLFYTLTVNILTTKKAQTSRTHMHIDVSMHVNVPEFPERTYLSFLVSPNVPVSPLQGHLPSVWQWSAALSSEACAQSGPHYSFCFCKQLSNSSVPRFPFTTGMMRVPGHIARIKLTYMKCSENAWPVIDTL